jgi:hypothetical protein
MERRNEYGQELDKRNTVPTPLLCRGCILRPQWKPKTTDLTKPYIYYAFFPIPMLKFHL